MAVDNSNEIKQALDINKSVWVSASAGSGKTTILVNRIITLLLNGVDIKKIICITYTRNGANEMKERIYKMLSDWVYMDDEKLKDDINNICKSTIKITDELLKKARTIFINLIDNEDELKIFTIHSFCQQILNKFPIEAGIQPNFEIVEGEEQKQLFKRAFNQFLFKDENNKYLAILDYISPRDFENKIFEVSYYKFDESIFFYILAVFNQFGDFNFVDVIQKVINFNKSNDNIYNNDFDINFAENKNENDFNKNDNNNVIQKLKNFKEQFEIIIGNVKNEQSNNGNEQSNFISAEELLELIKYVKEKYKMIFVKQAETIGNKIYNDNVNDKLDNTKIEQLKKWLSNDFENKFNNLSEYLTVFLTQTYEMRKKDLLDFKETERCFKFYQNYYNLENLYATILFSAILIEMRKYYSQIKKQKMLLDYNDLISMTNELLKNKESSEWVKYKLDNKIEHILLDEAQDTLPEQWRIINILVNEFFSGETANDGKDNSKRTLFVVGDEKQSIFGFQGANPKLFRENFKYYQQQLKEGLNDVKLQYSFRSCQNIIKFVNEIFKDEKIKEKITTEDKVEHKAFRQDMGYIELWPLIDVEKQKKVDKEEQDWEPRYLQKEEETKEELLAEYVVKKIKDFFNQTKRKSISTKKDGEPARLLKYSDIMLLLTNRNYKLLSFLIKQLNSNHIPNSGFDKFNLFENIFIKDLISLLNFVVFPRDDFNLATLIKSPILNMEEIDLRKICDLKNERQIPIIEVLKEYNKDKYEFLEKIYNNSKNKNGYDFFIYCLEQTNIKQNIMERAGGEFEIILTDFLSFVKQFTKESGSDLVKLLLFIKNNEYSLKKDLTGSKDLDQVIITTKHSSKGSEAPIVFILDAQEDFTKEKTVLNFKTDIGVEFPVIVVKKTILSDGIQQYINEKLKDESYRLFYVAITRACNELYICALNKGNAKTKKNENGEEKKVKNEDNFYHISKQVLKTLGAEEKTFEFDPKLNKYCFGNESKTTEIFDDRKDNIYRIYNKEYFNLQLDDSVDSFDIVVPSQFYNHSDRDFKFDNISDRILLGNATHKLLEILPNIEKTMRETIADVYLNNMLKDFDKSEIDKIRGNVFKILNDENYQQFFDSKNSRAEVPIIGEYGKQKISGQIDRLIEFDDKIVIIDYKNTFKFYKNIQEIPQQYIKQLQIYREILQKEYKNKSIECYILLTNFVRLIKID